MHQLGRSSRKVYDRATFLRDGHGHITASVSPSHRGGKTVIVVADFAPHITAAQIEDYARQLKKACGCGGTVRERTIEFQGDQPGKIHAFLEAAGFRVDGV